MRKSQWLLFSLVVCAALFVPTEASAIGCWVCDNALDSCFYYRQTELADCRYGCDRMYTPYSQAWYACRSQCNAQYNYGINQCWLNYDYCSQGCDDGGDDGPPVNCPVIVDLGKNNIVLTSAAEGVSFDIDADGRADAIAWTEPASDDGFLVFDRNQNGIIDSGRELFGDVTTQPPSEAKNGFLALALFDENSDGLISSIDPIFPGLQIWVDTDHDGRSSAGELSSLAANGIVAIDLDYEESRRRDRNGNEFRYRARVQLESGHTNAIDVFFKEQ